MMRWQSRALIPAAGLLLLGLAQLATEDLLRKNSALRLLLSVAMLCTLLTAVVFGAITLCQIFQTGHMAFGVRSGLTYTLLAALRLFWPGLFVVPHMIRLDVKRLLGVEVDEEKQRRP